MIPREDLSALPQDENTPEKRADKLWKVFDKRDNGEISFTLYWFTWHYDTEVCRLADLSTVSLFADRVAEGEFIQGVLENEVALRLIQYQPVK